MSGITGSYDYNGNVLLLYPNGKTIKLTDEVCVAAFSAAADKAGIDLLVRDEICWQMEKALGLGD